MTQGAAPGLAEALGFLRRGASYGAPGQPVQVVESHMSWVFLVGEEAWKLKKPYRHDCIDYATPLQRHRCCTLELELNRRLAPDVYLAVVPLCRDDRGALRLGGAGTPVDWLVRMRRLPAEASLERRLQRGQAGAAEAARVVARLLPFFAQATPARFTPAGFRRHLSRRIRSAAAELARPAFALDADRIRRLGGALEAFIQGDRASLDRRVAAGRIVDGHGDLRPEHVYLLDPPAIVDCIEFDRGLRLHDPVDELAFLALECARLGAPEFGRWLFAAWQQQSGEQPCRHLVAFYTALNALVRAKVAIWHLLDPGTGPPDRYVARTWDYLQRAERCMAALDRPSSRSG